MKNKIELIHANLAPEYRKKWNVGRLDDFSLLYKNGEKISDTLYRIGGLGVDINADYFCIMKHVEAFYPDNITKIKKDKPHLQSQWVILNNNCEEKVNIGSYRFPYLVGGCIYTVDSHVYNINTNELYASSSKWMVSNDFIFVENPYDNDKSKRGVLKINKEDGSFELFPGK